MRERFVSIFRSTKGAKGGNTSMLSEKQVVSVLDMIRKSPLVYDGKTKKWFIQIHESPKDDWSSFLLLMVSRIYAILACMVMLLNNDEKSKDFVMIIKPLLVCIAQGMEEAKKLPQFQKKGSINETNFITHVVRVLSGRFEDHELGLLNKMIHDIGDDENVRQKVLANLKILLYKQFLCDTETFYTWFGHLVSINYPQSSEESVRHILDVMLPDMNGLLIGPSYYAASLDIFAKSIRDMDSMKFNEQMVWGVLREIAMVPMLSYIFLSSVEPGIRSPLYAALMRIEFSAELSEFYHHKTLLYRHPLSYLPVIKITSPFSVRMAHSRTKYSCAIFADGDTSWGELCKSSPIRVVDNEYLSDIDYQMMVYGAVENVKTR